MKKIFINIILAFSLIIGNAQNEIDALRYSKDGLQDQILNQIQDQTAEITTR